MFSGKEKYPAFLLVLHTQCPSHPGTHTTDAAPIVTPPPLVLLQADEVIK
jgi:hypothetical protein